jgi:uroporphyrinogen decarboxylase
MNRRPDFEQFLKMIAGERPDRPVLFEHYIDACHVRRVPGARLWGDKGPPWGWVADQARAYAALGYDCNVAGMQWMGLLRFPLPSRDHAASVGQFAGGIIHDEASFRAYPWPDPELADTKAYLDGLATEMPAGMKLILGVPCGIYDTLIDLMGFEAVCLALADEPDLVEKVCRELGRRAVRIVERCIGHPVVGGVIFCDDWGFKTATFLPPADLRRLVFPWHKQIVEAAHAAGKIAILHACGCVHPVMDDIVAMGYDAKHSWEDAILPVEQGWERFGKRIAILGGLDVDFMSRSSPEAIHARARALVERTQCRHYALGTGNSVTPDMSPAQFEALLRAAESFAG